MTPLSKKQKELLQNDAKGNLVINKKRKKCNKWSNKLKEYEYLCETIYNKNRKCRNFEENILILLPLKDKLKVMIHFHQNEETYDIREISWTTIEEYVSQDLKVNKKIICKLQQEFKLTGSVLVRESAVHGRGSPK